MWRDRQISMTALTIKGGRMALNVTRSAGMLVLAVYLIIIGLVGLLQVPVPLMATAVLALVAGILILIGR
jgi:hypothetical protein